MDYKAIKDISYEEFKIACEASISVKEVSEKLGINPKKVYSNHLKELSHKYKIPLPIWENKTSAQKPVAKRTKWTPETMLVYGKHHSGPRLRKMMVSIGVPYFCSMEECPLHEKVEWCGKPITLQVDHIDGDNLNNELSNLRFLCANCHTQTETFANRSQCFILCECGRRRTKDLTACPHGVDLTALKCLCGAKKSYEASHCNSCANKARTARWIEEHAQDFPSISEMTREIEAKGWLSYSKELGITDNGLRKVFRRLGVTDLPKKRPRR